MVWLLAEHQTCFGKFDMFPLWNVSYYISSMTNLRFVTYGTAYLPNMNCAHTKYMILCLGYTGSEISLNNCNKSSITEKHKIHFSALAVEPRPWHYRLASEGHREGGEKSPLIFRRTKVAGRYPSSHLGPPPGVWKAPPSNFCGLEHGPSSLEGWLPASMVAVHPPRSKM